MWFSETSSLRVKVGVVYRKTSQVRLECNLLRESGGERRSKVLTLEEDTRDGLLRVLNHNIINSIMIDDDPVLEL